MNPAPEIAPKDQKWGVSFLLFSKAKGRIGYRRQKYIILYKSVSQQYKDYVQSLTGEHRELKREIDKLVKSKSKDKGQDR